MLTKTKRRAALCGSAAMMTLAALTAPTAVVAQTATYAFDLPAQDLAAALRAFGHAARQQVVFDGQVTQGKRSAPVVGTFTADEGLRKLLEGTGLTARRGASGVLMVSDPQSDGAPSAEAAVVDELIVTAQKKEESIQDVPIAVSAFSAQALDDKKIEGGAELLRGVPNVNFSKANFSMYNFSIRGIGTKAVSASSDPAVAISFNNTPLIRNRLFEQEFLDVERIEVLRGPQGTLYGRNATAGVVNMIPRLPGSELEAMMKAELGNFGTGRLSGMVNIPLGDTLAIRAAGALTKRDGFDYNTFTKRDVNNRDLWSTRLSAKWDPVDWFSANVIWEHFEEDDERSRTGKQLCTRDPGPEKIGNIAITDPVTRGRMSQGCLPGSLYKDEAFGVPNGNSLVYLLLPSSIGLGFEPPLPSRPTRVGPEVTITKSGDPFAGVVQSRNLREISTSYDPKFRAENDVAQLNLRFDVAEGLTLISQTAYARDNYYSSQDYNRFVSVPLFNDSTRQMVTGDRRPIDTVRYPGPTPKGVYCDPQLGCSDRMISADISQSRNRQWSQELRLQSSFAGPVNFSVGANYIDFKSQDDYYVFNNMFTLLAEWWYSRAPGLNALLPCELGVETRECVYVDPNPMGKLNKQGHNYFLSQNGVRIKSSAIFGELYWDVADDLKLTAGLRYTQDRKISTQVPSQLLLGGGTQTAYPGSVTGGKTNSGYPALPDIKQSWGEVTGRLVLDWKPVLSFTDDTLVYASVSRGYKGGGTNPPRVDFDEKVVQYLPLPETFRPEYVNAFEIGTKNSFDNGRLSLNATAFVYDYKDYQVSQIVDRIAFNENFDTINWGLEFEAVWRPTRAFRLDGNLGYLKTRLKKGSQSIDVMNRTQGNPDWVVLRPWIQVPSNCVAPRVLVERIMSGGPAGLRQLALSTLCPGSNRMGTFNPAISTNGPAFHALYGFTYDFSAPYDPSKIGLNIAQGGSGAPNGGRGFAADLTDNELPNSPNWTMNLGAQYTFFINDGDWELTFRGDYYRQSESYARIYNTEFDRLKAWDNVNVAVTLTKPASDVTFQLYVKNVFDKTPITDTFINSDDTGLTTNVFTLDPRIVGVSVMGRF
ncbi:TonB-dependent receptor domain-containing protein [Caulobacter mirabilis]|nr:TonB-dependent receptor [Caulobacter mirabilis]